MRRSGRWRTEAWIRDELTRCVRCGNCMAVCPVYELLREEGAVARGKIALVEALAAGDLEDDRHARHFLTACLLCGRCKSACPNEVDTPALVQYARARLARRSWLKRWSLGRLLPAQRLLPRLLRAARAIRLLWARRIPGSSGLHIRFSRGADGQRRRIPPLVRPFFLDRDHPPPKGEGPEVAFFVGCVHNYMRPESAQAAIDALSALGARVHVPAGQACCGLPAWGAGESEGARKLARRNLEALAPAGEMPDFVTSVCASCAYMLRFHMHELLEAEPGLAERARMLMSRVLPFSMLWSRLAGLDREGAGRQRNGSLLTYHDPCHLSRAFGEKAAPRFLLTRLRDRRFVEMSHPCRCCGHGGVFNLAHFELSAAMARDKARRVRESGASVVVTECSGCLLQLSEALAQAVPAVEVWTTAEALARCGVEEADLGQGED